MKLLKTPASVTSRKAKLISLLKTMVVVGDDNDEKQLYYRLYPIAVCKLLAIYWIIIIKKLFTVNKAKKVFKKGKKVKRVTG
jgi:hypothetical protein